MILDARIFDTVWVKFIIFFFIKLMKSEKFRVKIKLQYASYESTFELKLEVDHE